MSKTVLYTRSLKGGSSSPCGGLAALRARGAINDPTRRDSGTVTSAKFSFGPPRQGLPGVAHLGERESRVPGRSGTRHRDTRWWGAELAIGWLRLLYIPGRKLRRDLTTREGA